MTTRATQTETPQTTATQTEAQPATPRAPMCDVSVEVNVLNLTLGDADDVQIWHDTQEFEESF